MIRAKLLALVAVVGLTATESALGQGVAGEYRFWITNNQVTPPDTVARGRFVLYDDAVDRSAIEADLRSRVVRRSGFLLRPTGVEPNACFSFSTSQAFVGNRAFFGGIIESGLSVWKQTADTLEVPVFRSPDAWQSLAFGRDDLRGEVRQQYSDMEASSDGWLQASAERLAPASLASCEAVLRDGVPQDRGKRQGIAVVRES